MTVPCEKEGSTSTVATESQPLLDKKEGVSDIEDGRDNDKKTSTEAGETIIDDVIDILKLGVPIFITSFSWVGVSSAASEMKRFRCDISADE